VNLNGFNNVHSFKSKQLEVGFHNTLVFWTDETVYDFSFVPVAETADGNEQQAQVQKSNPFVVPLLEYFAGGVRYEPNFATGGTVKSFMPDETEEILAMNFE